MLVSNFTKAMPKREDTCPAPCCADDTRLEHFVEDFGFITTASCVITVSFFARFWKVSLKVIQ